MERTYYINLMNDGPRQTVKVKVTSGKQAMDLRRAINKALGTVHWEFVHDLCYKTIEV